MRKGETDAIAGFVEMPPQVVGAAFLRQQLNRDNSILGNPLQTKKARYNDKMHQRHHDPANRKHSFQSKHFYERGWQRNHGGQNYTVNPA